ncbi:hypothetical protein GXW83_23540 [Streptacidiphilus sp. PB12-B1b]|uniref:GNAT family N-acetyltransferase n=1 Tax=Streptacidiphilus sp. PB12-B1b TaxID=2705012 RepID=UPI0015FBF9E0|nr:GNAT family N-acetyltransferase [Streptacidiphilus sp. PB12-B1b]QMU78231.1 hypothetical protein GXW83_23540 [Streptacidiphilus sp. PB12-B1b]
MSLETAPFVAGLASPDDLRAWYEVAVAVIADLPGASIPPYETYARQLLQTASHQGPVLRRGAWLGGRLLGTATVRLPTEDNRELAFVTVGVPRQNRRAGVGTRLLQAVLPEIRESARSKLFGTVEAGADGEKWAHALGFRTVHQRCTHHLDIGATDPARWQAEPASGFRLQRWTDAAPDDLVHSFARARNAIADAPLSESSFRHPVWTVEKVRTYEAGMLERGETHRYVAAVDERSGELAGFTEVAVVPGQWSHCRQEDTAVLSQFRGLGLGLAVKAAMMRWLTADLPRLEQVRTVTAAGNLHMIRVNAQLGYQTDSTTAYVESDLGALDALLAPSRGGLRRER